MSIQYVQVHQCKYLLKNYGDVIVPAFPFSPLLAVAVATAFQVKQ